MFYWENTDNIETEDNRIYLFYCLWRQVAESLWMYKIPAPVSSLGKYGPFWVLASLLNKVKKVSLAITLLNILKL